MKRNKEYYQNCPAMVKFGLVGKEYVCAPEVLALATAIENQVSVTLKPRCRVYMIGEAVLPEGHGLSDRGVITRRVRGIEFERVRYVDDVNRAELYIRTDDGTFLAWSDKDGIDSEMSRIFERVRKEGVKLSDQVQFFEDMNYECTNYEIQL